MNKKANTLKNTSLVISGIALLVLAVFLAQPGERNDVIILATTTSTYDSGLLNLLLPEFTATKNIEVNVISVGTGQAITLAEQGDADIILIHAPASEQKFMTEGYGLKRECVMYNDFIILGPNEDPAEIKGLDIGEALAKISEEESTFVSRGDDSGTHKKEKALWEEIEIQAQGDWYQSIGQGMGETILMANEERAYTMADRGTYLSLKDKITLEILVEGDEELLNQYGIITVKSSEKQELAQELFDWMLEESTQENIEGFQKNGEQLFHPLRGECTLG